MDTGPHGKRRKCDRSHRCVDVCGPAPRHPGGGPSEEPRRHPPLPARARGRRRRSSGGSARAGCGGRVAAGAPDRRRRTGTHGERPDPGRRRPSGRRRQRGPPHPLGLPLLGLCHVRRLLGGAAGTGAARTARWHPCCDRHQGSGRREPDDGGVPDHGPRPRRHVDRGLDRLPGDRLPVLRSGRRRKRPHHREGGGEPRQPAGRAGEAGSGRARAAAGSGWGRSATTGVDGPAREAATDEALLAAGILPGDSSLYPRSLEDVFPLAPTGATGPLGVSTGEAGPGAVDV